MLTNLHYHPKMYLSESINVKKLDKIIKKLEKRPLLSGLYLITLSKNSSDQLDIFEAKQLHFKYYQSVPVYVVGLAMDHSEAVSLIETIVQDCLTEKGNCNLKEYLTWEQ